MVTYINIHMSSDLFKNMKIKPVSTNCDVESQYKFNACTNNRKPEISSTTSISIHVQTASGAHILWLSKLCLTLSNILISYRWFWEPHTRCYNICIWVGIQTSKPARQTAIQYLWYCTWKANTIKSCIASTNNKLAHVSYHMLQYAKLILKAAHADFHTLNSKWYKQSSQKNELNTHVVVLHMFTCQIRCRTCFGH